MSCPLPVCTSKQKHLPPVTDHGDSALLWFGETPGGRSARERAGAGEELSGRVLLWGRGLWGSLLQGFGKLPWGGTGDVGGVNTKGAEFRGLCRSSLGSVGKGGGVFLGGAWAAGGRCSQGIVGNPPISPLGSWLRSTCQSIGVQDLS